MPMEHKYSQRTRETQCYYYAVQIVLFTPVFLKQKCIPEHAHTHSTIHSTNLFEIILIPLIKMLFLVIIKTKNQDVTLTSDIQASTKQQNAWV